MHTIFNELISEWDEIATIEYVGEEDTIDINTTGNRLFYANDILTHNSAVDEIEFDHSHISGGISKINTADNVFGIFTSRSMRERGEYQFQLMKTRSSSGVGSKITLSFNGDSLRIFDEEKEEETHQPRTTSANIMQTLKPSSSVNPVKPDDDFYVDQPVKKVVADVQSSKLNLLLNQLKKK